MNAEKTVLVAHVKQDDQEKWASPHVLADHLAGTARLAKSFADVFQSGSWAEVLGHFHDVGKGTSEWQKYLVAKSGYACEAHLEGKIGKLDHSSIGAKLVEESLKQSGRFLSYCIAGHHGGLPDYFSSETHAASALQHRLNKASTVNVLNEIKNLALSVKPNGMPFQFSDGLAVSLWIRMLFSCLVDADFLDTELYMQPEKSAKRTSFASIAELLANFRAYMQNLTVKAGQTRVNKLRQSILQDCIGAASQEKGIFTLTVPTGGGKTLSSLAFALEHAQKHGQRRVIYVIPYTSIIEQNADVFRQALGEENVVEHHSNLDSEETTPAMRLAAENWDAPVIVTTTVQFYESLFSAKPGRCRKLHNIANSVVILDEAQLLPPDFLKPILKTLQLLVDCYSVSLVISTATQPALESRQVGQNKFDGLTAGKAKEIISDVPALYENLKRVEVTLPASFDEKLGFRQIAEKCSVYDQVLCVVSDRKSCRELHKLMPDGTIHLSALMCGQHRSDKIALIKEKLRNNETVRVISTQLVEAGVDIDFPVVFRALAGLDSIAQAAGRCNREGLLEKGEVFVFVSEKKSPPGLLRKAADTTQTMLHDFVGEPLSRENFDRFFQELYWKANSLDAKEIINSLTPDQNTLGIQFRTASDNFKLIDDSMQRNIIVRYGNSEKILEDIKLNAANPLYLKLLLRKLQRYSVNIYTNDFERLLKRKSIIEMLPGVFVLTTPMEYSDDTGLLVEENAIDPESFVL